MSDRLSRLDPTDRMAAARLLATRPRWIGLDSARSALKLEGRVLLHAGPPIRDRRAMAVPILNSAIMAALFEGWSRDVEEARALVLSPAIRLEPAQDHATVVPLADVLSPSMRVQVVETPGDPTVLAFAPLNAGVGPVMRVGQLDPAIVDRLRWLNGPFTDALARHGALLVDLLDLADAALMNGDDCHGRTPAASGFLLEIIGPRLGAGPEADAARKFLKDSPPFFLNLWMAACKCAMRSVEGVRDASIVTAAGGNGVEIGIKLAAMPKRWFTAPALAPVMPGAAPELQARALGAIGDSAVVDTMGFGAMALRFAPETHKALAGALPKNWRDLPSAILADPHPGLPRSRAWSGLAARIVVESGETPLISLGTLDRAGKDGRLGGGLHRPPLALYREAVQALASHAS